MSGRRKVSSLSCYIDAPPLQYFAHHPSLLSRSNIAHIVLSPHRCRLRIFMQNIGGGSRVIAKLIPAAATEI